MSTGARVAAAMASGYLLGRRRKIKLAIMMGGLLAGRRIATSPRGLWKQANEYVEANPELAKISDSVRTTLLESARQAAIGTASGGIERLSDAIHDRTDKLNTAVGAGRGDESEAADEAGAGEERAEAESVEDEPADGAHTERDRTEDQAEQRPKRRGGAGHASTKSSTAKKSSATKKSSAAKKASTTKKSSAAKKASSSQSSRQTSGTAKKAASSRTRSTRNRG